MERDQATKFIYDLLRLLVGKKGSDLFITVGFPPAIKLDGRMTPVSQQPLSAQHTAELVRSVMNDRQAAEFESTKECQFAISPANIGRFRVSAFVQMGNIGMVLRTINSKIPTFEELNLPPTLKDVAMTKRGLVIMVGATGSGKSTSLAAMINHRNENASDHILSVEDPIEFLHPNKKSLVNQREVGLDTKSFHRALRSAMRAAPDVILIGEIRDRESMEYAITFAGTGHLCLATLHANNASETLDRIINMFPRDQHSQIFLDLSQYLKAILSQRLVMGTSGKRCAAIEVLLNTPHVQELIKKGDVVGVKEALIRSGEKGMQSFDVALYQLCQQGKISMEEALANADSRTNLEAKINFG